MNKIALEQGRLQENGRRFGGGVVARSFLLLLLFTLAAPLYAAGNVLKDISFSALPGNSVQIVLTAEKPFDEPKSFSTDNPPRLAMDFFGMSSGLARKTQQINVGMARSITAIQAGNRTRVVVNLVQQTGTRIERDGNRLTITVEGSPQQVATTRKQAAVAAPRTVIARPGGHRVEGVDFRRGDAGEGRVVLDMNDSTAVVDMREEGRKVVLDIVDAELPERFMRKFDVSDFATPVKMFEVTRRGRNVHVEITTRGEYEHLAYQADDLLTVEFRPLTKEEKEEINRRKKTFTGERLSLNFQDIPVRSVLQLLADFTGLNLVTSDTVGGSITLRLQNVPWDQALDIILKARGLAMRKNGNVIMIAPTEEIAAREKLELESQKQIEELAPLHTEYIQINYAKAKDVQKLLKSKGNELLTPGRGNVTVDPRTNTLLVRDTAAKLEDIRRLVEKLDVPVRQVLIESRVVIANDSFNKELGVRLGFNRANAIGGGNEALIAGAQPGHINGTGALDTGSFMGVGAGIAEGTKENLMVNLPAAAATSGINLLIGKVGSYLLQLELTAMQEEGRGEVVSSPRVITSDKHKAVIKQGVEIPYQEASSSGATSVSFKEAVLQLEVTPNITPDDRVIMDLKVTKDNPDFSRLVLGTPPVDTRSIETSVLVDDGETVVLGGVFEREKTKNVDKVPFFGDLPYLGFFFKTTFNKNENKELLIFVSPKIVKESLSVR
ncbi:MAG TPA: type IV pilus secretin PilQ [Sedimenticola thiotaurini]|uniref:Type IV pilus secretin PilQ n=1 Tax=Sedimenticola thiotaurini TaxID=1543721 RepID=A0A831RQG4_9GAMM|nr:type IV pilus secretin PilQ [Sedimenticola thiotaurini]